MDGEVIQHVLQHRCNDTDYGDVVQLPLPLLSTQGRDNISPASLSASLYGVCLRYVNVKLKHQLEKYNTFTHLLSEIISYAWG